MIKWEWAIKPLLFSLKIDIGEKLEIDKRDQ